MAFKNVFGHIDIYLMEYIHFNVLRFQQWFMRMLEHNESFVNGNFKRNCWNVL